MRPFFGTCLAAYLLLPANHDARRQRGCFSLCFCEGVQGAQHLRDTVVGHEWPTLYVIDPKGLIRGKFIGSPAETVLDGLIESQAKTPEGKG